MKLKSLLFGSVAAMVAATGARAADPIVIAEPEPMDYVRICDMYGTGYYYIPGTETCLKIGGYYRVELRADSAGRRGYVRFAPTFTAKSETEWGTLTGYGRIFADWNRGATVAAVAGVPTVVTGYSQRAYLDQMYIELGNAFTVSLGLRETGYSQLLGYGGYSMDGGSYGYRNSGELRLSYNFGNGLSVFASAVEDPDPDWAPDAEFGARYDVSGYDNLWFGAAGSYDESSGGWTAKVAAEASIPNTPVTAKLMGFYSALGSSYAPSDGVNPARWSALGSVKVAATDMANIYATAQYFSTGRWGVAAGLQYYLHKGSGNDYFYVRPELVYASALARGTRFWGRVRFERGF